MTRLPATVTAMAAIAAAALALPVFPADAAGPYDGVWSIDLPATGQTSQGYSCPALRIQIRIADNQVSGTLHRTGPGEVQTGGSGSTAAPVTGSVNPDGVMNAQWEGYHASGKLSGNTGQLTVQRTCGPEEATATRSAP